MNWFKGIVVAVALAGPLPLLCTAPVLAESAAPAVATAKSDTAMDDKMSETDKRAKAADCSKQADAKNLHGEARKKFRSACKRGK